MIRKLYYILLFPGQETAEEGKEMCVRRGTVITSVHSIERFVQRRFRLPTGYYAFFKSASDIVDGSLRIRILAQDRYLEKMIAEGRLSEALTAFDRFYEETRLLCLSTCSKVISALFASSGTVEISKEAELYLKMQKTFHPVLEKDGCYFRNGDLIFVVKPGRIITCFYLEPHQIDVIDSLMSRKLIQTF